MKTEKQIKDKLKTLPSLEESDRYDDRESNEDYYCRMALEWVLK
jgi:hypothetical protein